MSRVLWIWKGLVHIASVALDTAIMSIIAKYGMDKTSPEYDKSYTTGAGFSCIFRICSQNSNIQPVPDDTAQFMLNWMIRGWFTYGNWSNH